MKAMPDSRGACLNMDGLIELVFERVPDKALRGLVYDLLQGAEVLEVTHSGLGSFDLGEIEQQLGALLMLGTESGISTH
ncbi:hypothetical protein [Rhizobacter sp. P5_C2]